MAGNTVDQCRAAIGLFYATLLTVKFPLFGLNFTVYYSYTIFYNIFQTVVCFFKDIIKNTCCMLITLRSLFFLLLLMPGNVVSKSILYATQYFTRYSEEIFFAFHRDVLARV